jgi:tryptophanyl-tRNA synthetase
MSKSENQNATLYLSDSDDTIRKKISKAKTESGSGVTAGDGGVAPDDRAAEAGRPKTEAVANLFQLLRLVSIPEVVQKFEADYEAGTIRYGDMKKELGEAMVAFIAPIREKAEAIRHDQSYLRRVMEQGAAKARASAQATLQLAREAIGLKYY